MWINRWKSGTAQSAWSKSVWKADSLWNPMVVTKFRYDENKYVLNATGKKHGFHRRQKSHASGLHPIFGSHSAIYWNFKKCFGTYLVLHNYNIMSKFQVICTIHVLTTLFFRHFRWKLGGFRAITRMFNEFFKKCFHTYEV